MSSQLKTTTKEDEQHKVGFLDSNGNDCQEVKSQSAVDGRWGWVVVAASFAIGVISGILYGGFSMLYVDISEFYNLGQGKTGFVGSIFITASTLPTVVMSAVVTRYGCRVVCIAGSLVTTLGFLLSWVSSSILVLIISYGVLAGTGYGMMTYTSTIIVQTYFDKHRAFAAGVANSGLSLGTIVTGPIIVYLNEVYSWRGTMLILSAMALNVCILASAFRPVSHTSQKPRSHTSTCSKCQQSKTCSLIKEIFDFSLLKQGSLVLYILTLFFMTMAVVPVFQHVPSRAHYHRISPHLIALLPTVTGVANFAAKIGCSFAANQKRVNRMLQYSMALIAGGLLTMGVRLAVNFPAFTIYCGVMGIFNGCAVVLRPTIVVDLVGLEGLPKAQAFLAVTGGIASLIGTPIAGVLFDETDNYDVPFYVLGSFQIVGGVLSIVNSCTFARKKGNQDNEIVNTLNDEEMVEAVKESGD